MSEFQELKDSHLHEALRLPEFQALTDRFDTDNELFSHLFQSTTRANVWVTDDEEQKCSVFVFDTNGVNKDKLLTVTNPKARTLYLWQIDGKMFTRFSKCDCAIIHDDILHLVEFKANARNESDSSIVANYDKAYSQLSLTLSTLQQAYKSIGKELFDVFSDIDAQIVFDRIVPQDNAYQKNLKSKFLEEMKIILTFGNDLPII